MAIPSARHVLNGPLSTYDMGWGLMATDLPPGQIGIFVGGQDLVKLTSRRRAAQDQLAGQERLKFRLGCFQYDARGRPICGRLDRSWKVTLETDPASKLPIVKDDPKPLPVWCSVCRSEFAGERGEGIAYQCEQCPEFSACWSCYDKADFQHDEDHAFQEVDIP